LVGFLFNLQLLNIIVILIPLGLCGRSVVASAAQLREKVCCTFRSHGLELRLREFLNHWLLLNLLFLLRLEQLATETSFHFLYDFGLVITESLKQLIEVTLVESFHNGELQLVNIIFT